MFPLLGPLTVRESNLFYISIEILILNFFWLPLSYRLKKLEPKNRDLFIKKTRNEYIIFLQILEYLKPFVWWKYYAKTSSLVFFQVKDIHDRKFWIRVALVLFIKTFGFYSIFCLGKTSHIRFEATEIKYKILANTKIVQTIRQLVYTNKGLEGFMAKTEIKLAKISENEWKFQGFWTLIDPEDPSSQKFQKMYKNWNLGSE